MSWGTSFNTEIHLNRKIFQSKYEVEDYIKELEENINKDQTLLKMFVSSNIKDIVPKDWDEEPINFINHEIDKILEQLIEDLNDLQDVNRYLDYLIENKIEFKDENDNG